MDVRITIFTPTYNRCHTLHRLYESLCKQSICDFEWLVVDDGSTDSTQQWFETINKAKFPIRYIRQNNGGKHTAINTGVVNACADWFFIVDSDDYLPPSSIETILKYTNQIQEKKEFCGVSGLRFWSDGKSAVSGDMNFDIIDSDAMEIRVKYGYKGDMAEIWRTTILKQFPFPVYSDEKFMTEGIVWSRISRCYKIRYFNENIYMGDRLSDGLIMNIRKHQHNSPKGSMLAAVEYAKDKRRTLIMRIKCAISYWRFSIGKQVERKGELSFPIWFLLCYPFGLIIYLFDCKKYNI